MNKMLGLDFYDYRDWAGNKNFKEKQRKIKLHQITEKIKSKWRNNTPVWPISQVCQWEFKSNSSKHSFD